MENLLKVQLWNQFTISTWIFNGWVSYIFNSFSGLLSYFSCLSWCLSTPLCVHREPILLTFNTSCLNILDPTAPLKEKRVIPKTFLWFNDFTRLVKRKYRKAERKWKKYKTNVLKLSKTNGFLRECSIEARHFDCSSLVASRVSFSEHCLSDHPSTCSVL